MLQSGEPLDEYSHKEVFVINAITAQCLVPKGFGLIFWHQISQPCEVEDFGDYFGGNVVCGVNLQEVINH